MGTGPRMGCWRTSLPRPRPISRGLALTKPLIVFTPSPFLRHRYGPSLTLCFPCPPPSITMASWWRRLQPHACLPASRSSWSAPGKSPLSNSPDTPGPAATPPHNILGTLAMQGVLDPQHPVEPQPWRRSRTGDGVSRPLGPAGQGWGLDGNQCLQVICVKTL